MHLRLTPLLAVVAAPVLLSAGCSPSAPAASEAAPLAAPVPAATGAAELALNIHHTLLIPGSEVLYSAESAPPTVAAAWAAVQQGAAKVSQGAEQLTQNRAQDNWTTLARQLGEAANAAGAASAAANVDQLRLANERLTAACTGCHQAYAAPKP